MKRRIKTLVAVTTLAFTASASIHAEACDRGGRRISLSRGRIGASFSPFNRYSPPTYAQPQVVYRQPQVVYQQPVQALPPSRLQPVEPNGTAIQAGMSPATVRHRIPQQCRTP